jgi:hypothetical protein
MPHGFARFSTVEEERRHRKQRVAAVLGLLGHFGFDEGVAGDYRPLRTPTRCTARLGRRCGARSIPSRRIRTRCAATTGCSTTTPALSAGKRRSSWSNHGLLNVWHTVDEAAWWFITMECTCQAQLLAVAAGTPVLIDHDQAQKTAVLSVAAHYPSERRCAVNAAAQEFKSSGT